MPGARLTFLYSMVLLGALFAGAAQSQSAYWRHQDGQPAQETDFIRSKNGFGGSVIATTDEDWKEKWDTPPDTKPKFGMAGTVPYGKKVFILTFFSNPGRDRQGHSDVRCDLKITNPKGEVALTKNDASCFAGKIGGSPYHVYLSGPVIAFSGDPGDPAGTWVVDVKLRDALRQVELPLRTSFELK